MNLEETYRQAARVANHDGVRASNEDAVIDWIRQNCAYRADMEFFLFLGICSEIANIEARSEGYKDQFDRAFIKARVAIAKAKGEKKEGL